LSLPRSTGALTLTKTTDKPSLLNGSTVPSDKESQD
jgi:hypothetical protein